MSTLQSMILIKKYIKITDLNFKLMHYILHFLMIHLMWEVNPFLHTFAHSNKILRKLKVLTI